MLKSPGHSGRRGSLICDLVMFLTDVFDVSSQKLQSIVENIKERKQVDFHNSEIFLVLTTYAYFNKKYLLISLRNYNLVKEYIFNVSDRIEP